MNDCPNPNSINGSIITVITSVRRRRSPATRSKRSSIIRPVSTSMAKVGRAPNKMIGSASGWRHASPMISPPRRITDHTPVIVNSEMSVLPTTMLRKRIG